MNSSPQVRKALIYHELGHCLLGLEHNSEYELLHDEQNHLHHLVKLSIMNPTVMNDLQASFVEMEWEKYIDSLYQDKAFEVREDIDFEELRQRYYSGISAQEMINEDGIRLNSHLMYDYLCINGEAIFRNQEKISEEVNCF